MSPELVLLAVAIVLTIGVSGLCSILEAMVLSSTTAEIEALKEKSPKKGAMLERFRSEIEETSSAILSLNTIANTLGATLIGGLAQQIFGAEGNTLLYFAIGLTIGILLFAEILPKNMGVLYRSKLQGTLVFPLAVVRFIMAPAAKICKATVKAVVSDKPPDITSDEEEIILLARKGAKEGNLSTDERDMIANALNLDDVMVGEIMTPRTVMAALEENATVEEVFSTYNDVPFGRLPVYRNNADQITGMVRRRDLLRAKADDNFEQTVLELAEEILFVPEKTTADKALRTFLRKHQQFAIVVDEFGSTAGVLTMEDIMESILGREIFEKDDVAIDMRELAMRTRTAKDSAEAKARTDAKTSPVALPKAEGS